MSEPVKQKDEATVQVPAKGLGTPGEGTEPQMPPGPNPELADDRKLVEMTPEDRELKERLELAVTRLKDPQPEIVSAALELLRKELREATSSMTSVPKPLKFLGPHFPALKAVFKGFPQGDNRLLFADILSVLAMTFGVVPNECLRLKLLGHRDDLPSWGTEYVRSLAGEIGSEWAKRDEEAAGGAQPEAAAASSSADTAPAAADSANAAAASSSPTAASKAAAKAKEAAESLALLGPPPSHAELTALITQIVPFHMAHNAEVEAVDLLLETESLELLAAHGAVDAASFPRVCLYLLKCADYLGSGEEAAACFSLAFRLYLAHGQLPDALRVALRAHSSSSAASGADGLKEQIKRVFDACAEPGVKRQLGYILGRHRVNFVAHDDDIDALIGNAHLPELYAALARDLDTAEPKTPEDIYKAHLAGDKRDVAEKVDSAKANLAATYVNAFVNAGYGTDKLLTAADSGWVFKNKDTGVTAAAASLGLLHLWNEGSLSELDKYLHADDDLVRAGALLGMGVMCAGTRNLDIDPAFALLSEHLAEGTTSTPAMRLCAALGLGLAYAGSRREDIAELLTPYVADPSPTATMEMAAVAGLAIGLIFVGSAHEVHAAVLADRLMEANDAEAGQAIARHLSLGLGLLFLGSREAAEPIGEVVATISHPIGRFTSVLLTACAYAGTGDVLRVQELLRLCAEHPEAQDKEKAAKEAEAVAEGGAAGAKKPAAAAAAAAGGKGAGGGGAGGDDKADSSSSSVAGKYLHQSAAVLGLALVSMGEELSVDMATRMADHLLQYGDAAVRRAVPLALGLLHVSDPDYAITDVLSKLSHDPHEETAAAAIFAMGLIGAGTNNSRIAGLLRTLAVFYRNDPNQLFVVRIAQAQLHAGKGLVTLNPLHSDRLLLSPVGLGGLLTALLLALDPAAGLHGKHHFLLYGLAAAMNPRFLSAVDEKGAPLSVEVRVGAAVETVGQAGRPKSITGFQTHSTPVLLGVRDRAELADADAWLPASSVLEGVVVLKPNPAVAATAGKGGAKKKAGAGTGAGK